MRFGVKSLRRIWMALAMLVLMLQVGCVGNSLMARRTPVPGSNIYCISMATYSGFRSNLKSSHATYGMRKLGGLGSGSVCDLVEFETYTVNWQTKDGRSESYEFDFEKIMRKFQDETPAVMSMQRVRGQPDLLVYYANDRIEVSYVVLQYQPDGVEMRNGLQILTKPATTTKFPLLTVPLSPPAAETVPK